MYQEAVTKLTGENLIKAKFDNFIGGKWVAPVRGAYFDNLSPISGKVLCQVARSTAEDIELALDAAHAAKDAWGRASAAERSNVSAARSPTASRPISPPSRWSRRSTTASRSARRPTPTCR